MKEVKKLEILLQPFFFFYPSIAKGIFGVFSHFSRFKLFAKDTDLLLVKMYSVY